MTKLKLATFDLETSGVRTDEDRIITCFLRAKDGDRIIGEHSWVIDAGVEIPEVAAEVHGMDTAWVREHGRKDVSTAIEEIVHELSEYAHAGYIIGGYNHSFDLAMLEAEAKRYNPGITGLRIRETARFLCPLTIDRAVDKYRKGSRKLVDVAHHYGVEVDESTLHDASGDVTITEKLIPKVLNKAWDSMGGASQGLTRDEFIDKLQELQVEWKRDWATHLTEYFEKIGKTEEDGSKIVVNGGFPW